MAIDIKHPSFKSGVEFGTRIGSGFVINPDKAIHSAATGHASKEYGRLQDKVNAHQHFKAGAYAGYRRALGEDVEELNENYDIDEDFQKNYNAPSGPRSQSLRQPGYYGKQTPDTPKPNQPTSFLQKVMSKLKVPKPTNEEIVNSIRKIGYGDPVDNSIEQLLTEKIAYVLQNQAEDIGSIMIEGGDDELLEGLAYPDKPEPKGECHNCKKPMNKPTSLWCNGKCKNKYYKIPSLKTMEKWSDTGIARATDNCKVEPDGHCVHQKPSWLISLGMI